MSPQFNIQETPGSALHVTVYITLVDSNRPYPPLYKNAEESRIGQDIYVDFSGASLLKKRTRGKPGMFCS